MGDIPTHLYFTFCKYFSSVFKVTMLSGQVIRSRHGGLALGRKSRRRQPILSAYTGRIESCLGIWEFKSMRAKGSMGLLRVSHGHEGKAGLLVGTTGCWCGASAQAMSGVSGDTRANVEEETLKCFQKLQNGSDIRGVALQLKEKEAVTLRPGHMYFVGQAFASWLKGVIKDKDELKVSVGSDPRLSSPMLRAAMASGLMSQGVCVMQFGMCTTPAMFMSCVMPDYACDGGIMITASHLPVNRNGAKFFTKDGSLGKPDIKAMLNDAARRAIESGFSCLWEDYDDHAFVMQKALECDSRLLGHDDFLKVYALHLRRIVIDAVNHPTDREHPLKGLKVVVNPGNGSGGYFATDVLGPLGADVSGSIHLTPDGSFPAHQPNPEDKGAVVATQEAVALCNADLGIMLDTDVDRSGFIDKDGKVINRNRYIALASAIALRDSPGATIVTDSCTSNGLKDFIESLGGVHFRFKKGYKNIIDKGIELNSQGIDCPLMMETSGHGALRENYFLDDGAYGALKIVIEAIKRRLDGLGDISDMLKDLKEPKEAMEIRVKILAEDVQSEGAKITAAFKEWIDQGAGNNDAWELEQENYEGWRVKIAEQDGNQGWLLLRPSLHDPDIVINVESEEHGGMAVHLQHLLQFFKLHPEFHASVSAVEEYVAKNTLKHA